MRITLEAGQFGWDYLIVSDDGRTVLIQTDYDYPGVASTFGAPELEIVDAAEWLADNVGATVDDPGYFEGEE